MAQLYISIMYTRVRGEEVKGDFQRDGGKKIGYGGSGRIWEDYHT